MTAKKNGLTFFDKLMLWLNYALAATLLIGYLAPVVDPRKLWIIAFFGLAYPPVFLANLLFIVYWLFRRSRWALLSLACILIGWKTLNSNIGLRLPVKKVEHRDSGMLRVMNYNVHMFKIYGSINDVVTKHTILELIGHEQPDIIGFEEFFSRKKGEYALVDSIKNVLKTDQCYFQPFMSNDFEGIGMAVFSKYPIVNKGIVWLNQEHKNLNQCIYIDVKKNNKIIRMYVIHLQSISFDPQDYKSFVDASKQGKADMHGFRRIGSKLKQAFLSRSQQVTIFKEHISGCPYPYMIIGDFNDTPSSYAVNQMSKGLKNAFREKGSGLGRTYNGDVPNYQIDYILTSQQFDVLTYGVIRKKASDHYPVYSDLRLRP
jgi:endonuclease/exonuclease/phosphatase family metal-dependent hydrolase